MIGIMSIVKWIFPALFVLIGYFLSNFIHGHSFLGLCCFAIAALLVCYFLVGILRHHNMVAGKVLLLILNCALCFGLLVFGITELVILNASRGSPEVKQPYIVVLGAKVRDDGPSVSLWDRINAAADYLKAHEDTIAIVSGGQGEDEPITEAQCMHDELVKLGIDESRIWMEDKATSTDENMRFSLDLIEEKTGTRPEKLAILSSEYHLYRSSLMAKKLGIEFVGVPAKTSRLSQLVNHAMREVAGVWHFYIFGR